MIKILPIVEGDGDLAAVPELIRRVAHAQGRYDVNVLRPHKRGDIPKVKSRFDDFLQIALLESAPILWVLDFDCEDCLDPAAYRREFMERAAKLKGQTPVEFVFMVQEFETLFLADHETTRSVFADIPTAKIFPANPESVRDAKGWISEARPKGSAYKPTQHQQRIAAQVNLDRLRVRSASFRRFEEAVSLLLAMPNAVRG